MTKQPFCLVYVSMSMAMAACRGSTDLLQWPWELQRGRADEGHPRQTSTVLKSMHLCSRGAQQQHPAMPTCAQPLHAWDVISKPRKEKSRWRVSLRQQYQGEKPHSPRQGRGSVGSRWWGAALGSGGPAPGQESWWHYGTGEASWFLAWGKVVPQELSSAVRSNPTRTVFFFPKYPYPFTPFLGGLLLNCLVCLCLNLGGPFRGVVGPVGASPVVRLVVGFSLIVRLLPEVCLTQIPLSAREWQGLTQYSAYHI